MDVKHAKPENCYQKASKQMTKGQRYTNTKLIYSEKKNTELGPNFKRARDNVINSQSNNFYIRKNVNHVWYEQRMKKCNWYWKESAYG